MYGGVRRGRGTTFARFAMSEKKFADLIIEGKTYKLPIIEGTEGEKAIDISSLRRDTGYITLDPAFANTGACCSEITYIDGEKGIIRYRGIPLEDLAGKVTFIQTAYLLIHGEMPSAEKLKNFSQMLNKYSLLHEDMRHFFDGFPKELIRCISCRPCSTGFQRFIPI